MSETISLREALADGVSVAQVLQNLRQRVHATVPMAPLEKGKYIRENFPEMAAETIRLANEALEGMMVLPGTGPGLHFVGNPPRWQENPPDDNEYTFHLNRMHHWKTMSEAYSLTGDVRYAEKVVAECLDWIETNPCPALHAEDGSYALARFEKRSTWRALEVGIRGYRTWPLMIELLIDSGCITQAFLEKLLPCVALHCRVLYEISPRLWPKADHNHYLMENLGLLSFACLFPELRGSEQWKAQAQRELDRCIDAQCMPCGAQIEGCPSYHNGCVFWFALRILLAEKYGLQVSQHYREKVQSMLRHSIHATRASGGNFPWGDSHISDKETMALAAVSCYLAFDDWKDLAAARYFYPRETLLVNLRDNLWRLRNLSHLKEDLARADANPIAPQQPLFAWQKELDQVYLRSGWDKNALSLMTGCRTPVQNLHAHMDAGGFDFTAYGAPLVADPGIFTYRDCEDRHNFKGSLWHSCLTIDRQDMWEYRGSWSYGPQKEGHIVFAQYEPQLSYVVSRHFNYSPVTATRVLAMVENRFLLVLDEAENVAAGRVVEIGFHLDRTEVCLTENGAVTRQENAPNLCLVSDGAEDSVQLEAARISLVTDVAHPSCIVRYHKQMQKAGTYRQATLLVPFATGEQQPCVTPPVLTRKADGALHIALTVNHKTITLQWQNDRLLRIE